MGRVVFQGVTKRFDSFVAVDDLDLEVADREFLVLLGPSGCGKSTALRMIAGLEDPTEGSILIGEPCDVTAVEPKNRDVAMVFQSYALYPHMTVRKNIEFPLRTRKVGDAERTQLVDDAARSLGLDTLLDRKPAQLSGGQRQRVALARAIVRRPQVFLMDEPLSNLDAKLRVQTRGELIELHRRLETTFVYVTHDQVEAMTMGERIAIMLDGKLQQVGPPQEVYERPANLFVASFIGSPPMNTFAANVDGDRVVVGAGALRVVAPPVQGPVVVGVRPEHLMLRPDGPLTASVQLVESLGHERHVICRLETGDLVTVRQAAHLPVPGDRATVGLDAEPESVSLFSADAGGVRLGSAP